MPEDAVESLVQGHKAGLRSLSDCLPVLGGLGLQLHSPFVSLTSACKPEFTNFVGRVKSWSRFSGRSQECKMVQDGVRCCKCGVWTIHGHTTIMKSQHRNQRTFCAFLGNGHLGLTRISCSSCPGNYEACLVTSLDVWIDRLCLTAA